MDKLTKNNKDKKLLLRSMLFVPGHNDKLLLSASRSHADALILDVEDSVMPISNKQIARDMIRKKVKAGLFKNFHVFVRVNNRKSAYLLKDLSALMIEGILGFIYPKVHTKEDIDFFDKLLEAIEAEKGFPSGKFKIVPLIETSAAVINAQEICLVSDRVVAVAFACEDFIADLEGLHTKKGNSLFVPRALISMAARASGVIPIDTVHIDVHDLEDLEKSVQLAKELGFEGSLVLHPKEIEIVHKYYTPTPEEVKEAKEMLHLSDEAEKQNRGVAIFDGKFIGPPMVIAAKKLIEKYILTKSKEENRK